MGIPLLTSCTSSLTRSQAKSIADDILAYHSSSSFSYPSKDYYFSTAKYTYSIDASETVTRTTDTSTYYVSKGTYFLKESKVDSVESKTYLYQKGADFVKAVVVGDSKEYVLLDVASFMGQIGDLETSAYKAMSAAGENTYTGLSNMPFYDLSASSSSIIESESSSGESSSNSEASTPTEYINFSKNDETDLTIDYYFSCTSYYQGNKLRFKDKLPTYYMSEWDVYEDSSLTSSAYINCFFTFSTFSYTYLNLTEFTYNPSL